MLKPIPKLQRSAHTLIDAGAEGIMSLPRAFKGDTIATDSDFPDRVSADALLRRTCADG
jgi:hypothetical protein